MKILLKHFICISLLYILFTFQPAFSEETNDKTSLQSSILVTEILNNLEAQYKMTGFSADFYQESPLADIDITESAEGRAFFKKPEKFRWEYKTPDILHYISDGNNLWIHSPEDSNVWVGKTSAFFGKGSSASFLTDIKLIKKKFNVTISDSTNTDNWKLLLLPTDNNRLGIKKIFLTIEKNTNYISKIISFNINNEETRITLSNYNFKEIPLDSLFSFEIPKNANVIPLEE